MGDSLSALVAAVEGREKTLAVRVPPGSPLVDALGHYFASQNVKVVHEPVTPDEPRYAVVLEDDSVLGAVPTDRLHRLVDGTGAGPDDVNGSEPPLQPLLEHLDSTTFTSYDRDRMRRTSREIEDRAWRMRAGTLHAGFQRLASFLPQSEVYRTLASTGIDVHVYGAPDADVRAGDLSVHPCDDPAVRDVWFVVYDGACDDVQKCALLAEERDAGRYYGFWTYEPALVDDALAAIDRLSTRTTD